MPGGFRQGVVAAVFAGSGHTRQIQIEDFVGHLQRQLAAKVEELFVAGLLQLGQQAALFHFQFAFDMAETFFQTCKTGSGKLLRFPFFRIGIACGCIRHLPCQFVIVTQILTCLQQILRVAP